MGVGDPLNRVTRSAVNYVNYRVIEYIIIYLGMKLFPMTGS
jgi:hypothetical protein